MKEYKVDIDGIPHTFLLDPEDAERVRARRKTAHEAETADDTADDTETKIVTPKNK